MGWLKAYQFLDESHHAHVEDGPQRLVADALASGALQACVVEKASEHLLGRSLSEDEDEWVNELSHAFVARDFNYAALIREIVTSETYRSLP